LNLEFPENRENNREFANFRPFWPFVTSIYAAIPVRCTQFPAWPEQASFDLANREFVGRNREFTAIGFIARRTFHDCHRSDIAIGQILNRNPISIV
jgi:hypothetical protein